jgi:hypothetical protein
MKPFVPPFYLRSPALQTLLNSTRLRNPGKGGLETNAVEKYLVTGEGTKLQYYESSQPGPAEKTVILLPGWEGSHESAYIVNTGRYLFDRGYSVIRLNPRDHGTSHAFNRGLFYGTLLDETFDAVRILVEERSGRDVYLAGFSLGANFTLRIARKASRKQFYGLKGCLAVNPPLDPDLSTRAIDDHPLLRKYFMGKWKRSLAIKQGLFPDLYELEDVLAMETLMDITRALIDRYTEYRDPSDYFSRYTMKGRDLAEVALPLTILMSRDDPVIPFDDFLNLELSPSTELVTQKYGGHCGYISGPSLGSWYQPFMEEIFR